jgi:hypothetical protein
MRVLEFFLWLRFFLTDQTGKKDLIPIRYKKYNVADSYHCEGVRPEAIFHQ